MPTEAKRETIEALRAELDASRTMIVSEYRGLKVKEITEIRRALRKSDVSVPGRQEPPHADRGAGQPCRGRAVPAPHGPVGDRLRYR